MQFASYYHIINLLHIHLMFKYMEVCEKEANLSSNKITILKF